VTTAFSFRAATLERTLLPRVLAAGDALHPEIRDMARTYVEKHGGGAV
jgi:hypothetical protein